jgi:hypothetical protein
MKGDSFPVPEGKKNILRAIRLWKNPGMKADISRSDPIVWYYEKARFTDVGQGIVIQENGKYLLKNTRNNP